MTLNVSKGCEASCPNEAGPSAFSMVPSGNSDILSSCEMKDEPAFKTLPGNPAFFRVRATRCPFHLRQQTQGSYLIPIPEGSMLHNSYGKLAYIFIRSQGISSHFEMIWCAQSFPHSAVFKLVFL